MCPSFTCGSSDIDPVDLPSESGQLQTSGMRSMCLLSKFFALEKTTKDRFAELRSEIEMLHEDNAAEAKLATERVNHFGNLHKQMPIGDEGAWSFAKLEASLPTGRWMPLGVKNMPAVTISSLAQQPLPLAAMTTFTRSFLVGILGGDEWSPGLYYPANAAKQHSKQLRSMIKSKSYYVMDTELDPFVPMNPAENGAKITVFFRENDVEHQHIYDDVPLFVALKDQKDESGEKLYSYLGTYVQSRWSDKLDYDRAQEIVPLHIKEFWASRLASPQREKWLERALMDHFWPMPRYEGFIPQAMTNGATTQTETTVPETGGPEGTVKEDMKSYIRELMEWQKEAKLKVGLLKKENIMEAFNKEDAAEEPGLRFWWEYLQCVGFDRNFYYLLATAKKESETGANGKGGNGTI